MPPATTFLLSEDEAMKNWLTGMSVVDEFGRVHLAKVWFRMPEQELRDVTFPFVTLDLIDINEAPERNHRGRLRMDQMGYVPEGLEPDLPGSTQTLDYPVPFDLDYQVAHYSRSARHDRALQGQMWKRFLGRFGVLPVTTDGTARTAQLLGSVTGDRIDEHGKRLFTKVYTVRVTSEIVPADAEVARRVLTRVIDIVRIP